jgi:hypothetical protein
MKTLKYITSFIIVLLVLPISSCKKYFEDINVSDNKPLDVPLNVLLPSAEGQISYALGGDAARYTGIFVQYITGASRQFATYQRYSFHEDDFDNLWRLNLYAGPMQDLHIIINKASSTGHLYYQGIGEILMAYSLGMVTDYWGAAPFSDAFRGEANLQPAFDSESQIYSTIQSLLENGITHLSGSDNSILQPGGDDLIYGGDLASWIGLANGLKARYYIHLSKMDVSNAQKALDAIAAGGLTDNSGDAQFVYGETETTANPWYQYIEQRDDIAYDGYALQTMIANNDPRYGVYIDTADVYWGTGYLGPYFASISAPVTLFSYSEQKFIEAEANFRLGNTAAAATALGEGVVANMAMTGVDTASAVTYIAAHVTGTTNLEETIMYEKYIALFLQPEAWTDWRRTGYPILTPNVSGREIPRRFIYPTSERLYNPNTPQTSTLYSPRLFWDN